MKLQNVLARAEELLEDHGFAAEGWTVRFERGVRRAGQCDFGSKEIRLDVSSMLAYTAKQVDEIIVHELGHARAGAAANHGPAWAKAVRELGGSPDEHAPAVVQTGDPLKFLAILATIIFTGFWFGIVWGILAILAATLIATPKIWRAVGPIEAVYKLDRS